MEWQPLSIREGRRQPPEPFEGVPPHLAPHLEEWFRDALSAGAGYVDSALLQAIALRLHVPVEGSSYNPDVQLRYFVGACSDHAELFLDAIDLRLRLRNVSGQQLDKLKYLLSMGGSVWTVGPDDRSLQRRVGETAQEQAAAAMSPDDQASAELAEAWSKVYGRHPDNSDAWDHAIKAVEELLRPVVSPANTTATLGTMLRDMKAKPSKWTFVLGTDPQGTEALIAMLGLMWPNPDRHGGGGRKPTQHEAEAVVQTAVTVVQWLRAGGLALR